MVSVLTEPARVSLWAGWSIELPPSRYQRNEDGSWSAWGKDWTVDVHIIEASGDRHGMPVRADQILGETDHGKGTSGRGWTGTTNLLIEKDDGRDVYRLAGRLGAKNTLMSCWVSYMREDQRLFAQALIDTVVHDEMRRSEC
jgi:hypothetical protein